MREGGHCWQSGRFSNAHVSRAPSDIVLQQHSTTTCGAAISPMKHETKDEPTEAVRLCGEWRVASELRACHNAFVR